MSLRKMKLLVKHINPTSGSHNASVIFLHGSGDTGRNLIEWVRFLLGRDMEFPHIKVIYPTAPFKPYTPLGGQMSNVWFDRQTISIEAPENRQSLEDIYEKVNEMINEEVSQGVPVNRIIVGGFSMGGALAMHAGYHLNNKLGGVFACSSFLNRNSIVYESLKNSSKDNNVLPELKMFHGGRDTLVPIEWGKESFDNLSKLEVKGTFTPLKNTLHELKKQELLDLQEWILQKLPPLE
ncbi:lysophospholipase-like protein 1 [Lucilia sericata]|uniref:lysophospholipase-like protein 1 n=1 Tax=Lucilia sericata TaxID=13632 RepID=UPI0018A83398|nr:lysophospholipase-like protein 1 [Lucilia sericata]